MMNPSQNFSARDNTDVVTTCYYDNNPGFRCQLVMCYFLVNRQAHVGLGNYIYLSI